MKTPTTAKAGDTFVLRGEQLEVKAGCADDAGTWFCASHGEGFASNLGKDLHLSETGEHTLVWMCSTHGPEVP